MEPLLQFEPGPFPLKKSIEMSYTAHTASASTAFTTEAAGKVSHHISVPCMNAACSKREGLYWQ